MLAAGHAVDGGGGLLGEPLRDQIEALRHHLLQARRHVGEFVVNVFGLEVEAGREPVAGRRDGGGRLVAGGFQAIEQVGAALAERIDHAVAGVSQRERDVFALFGERTGDALRHFVDLLGDQIADRGDVVRQIEMNAADRLAHLFGLADQGVALIGQFAQQIADADFVVVIGALERRYFVVHQGFEFGGAGQRALDAVAHGGDFAANGLADRDDLLARGGFRLRQAHCHLGHGFGDQPHVLRAAEHMGDHIKENHRNDDGGGDADQRGDADIGNGDQGLQIGARQIGQRAGAGDPAERGNRGDRVGSARATAAQRLQDLAHIGAVVIGGQPRGCVAGRPVRRVF